MLVAISQFSTGQINLISAVHEAMLKHGRDAGLSPPEAIAAVRFACDILQQASDKAARDIFKPSDN